MTEASERGRQRGKREGGGEQGKKEVGNDFLLRRRLQMEREREEERPWNLLFAVASSVRQSVRPSVNEGSEKSLRFGERDWSRTTFTAEAEGSAKKGEWAAARGTATALAGHTGRGRTTHETVEQQHVPRPGASAVHFTRAPGAGSETVDDGGKV